MSETKDLKELLERMKGEVLPLPPSAAEPRPRPAPEARVQPSAGLSRFQRFSMPEPQRPMPRETGGPNLIWSENKEAMLFGVLASIIMAFGGILAGLDYLVMAGAGFFMLFSLVMFLALFGHYLSMRRRSPHDSGLAARVDALSRKVEMLSSRAASAVPAASSSGGGDRALEGKVEELRVLVKNLSRAIEQSNK